MSDAYRLKFNTPDDLAEFLKHLSARLGYINPVAAGESQFVWWDREALRAMTRMAPLSKADETANVLGDGWEPRTAEDRSSWRCWRSTCPGWVNLNQT